MSNFDACIRAVLPRELIEWYKKIRKGQPCRRGNSNGQPEGTAGSSAQEGYADDIQWLGRVVLDLNTIMRKTIRSQINDLKDTVELSSSSFEYFAIRMGKRNFKGNLSHIREQYATLTDMVKVLESRIDYDSVEMEGLKSIFVVHDVPVTKKEDCKEIIQKIADKMSIPFSPIFAYRSAEPTTAAQPPVIMALVVRAEPTKELIQMMRTYEDKITSSWLDHPGFFDENLSGFRRVEVGHIKHVKCAKEDNSCKIVRTPYMMTRTSEEVMAEFCEIDRAYGFGGSRSSSSIFSEGSPSKKKTSCKDDAIKSLRGMITANNNPDITCTDDDFLSRFIFARKMNVEESYELMCNYFAYRKRNPELFQNLSTSDPLIKQALYDGFPGVLPNKDRKGRTILIFFCNNWEDNNYPLEVIYRSLIISLEKLLCEVHNQANGFVVIVDWTDVSLRQVTSLANKTLKLMIEGLQDCFPARFKGIHFINQPWYIDPVITLLKAFLKEKTKKKIYVHGNNMSTLHEHIPIDVLPAELGGEGPPYSPTVWAHTLTQMCGYGMKPGMKWHSHLRLCRREWSLVHRETSTAASPTDATFQGS